MLHGLLAVQPLLHETQGCKPCPAIGSLISRQLAVFFFGAVNIHIGVCQCRYMDVELQQRAVEYLSLERQPELARANVTAMPPWEKRKSLLLRRMAEREVRCTPYDGISTECDCGRVLLSREQPFCQSNAIYMQLLPYRFHCMWSSAH